MNWIVRIYDENNKVVDHWIIKDRSEMEASKEAMSEIEHRHPNCADWTLTRYYN